MEPSRATAVEQTIRDRQTVEVLADEPAPVRDRRAVAEAAGWTPFHRPAAAVHREALPSPVPWRVCALDAAACRTLRVAPGEAGGKVAALLATADALLRVTWLPDPPAA